MTRDEALGYLNRWKEAEELEIDELMTSSNEARLDNALRALAMSRFFPENEFEMQELATVRELWRRLRDRYTNG